MSWASGVKTLGMELSATVEVHAVSDEALAEVETATPEAVAAPAANQVSVAGS